MALYRVIKDLAVGMDRSIPKGTISSLKGIKPESIPVLEANGSIARVHTPPVSQIPGWKTRHRNMSAAGLANITVEEFLETDDTELAKKMKTSDDNIRTWKAELMSWLTPPSNTDGCCG